MWWPVASNQHQLSNNIKTRENLTRRAARHELENEKKQKHVLVPTHTDHHATHELRGKRKKKTKIREK